MIRLIEELSLSALPALETAFLDGWVLRFSDNFTRRANSINPLYASTRPLADNLRDVEEMYRRKNQRVVFKMTPASLPEGLDQVLADEGYAKEAETAVMTLDLSDKPVPARGDTRLLESLATEWITELIRLNGVPERHQHTLQQIMLRLAPRAVYAGLAREGEVVSLGLGVLEANWLGLYDIVTVEAERGKGRARRLINDMLGWAMLQGAKGAYLQVMKNNDAAIRLYDGLGFKEQYEYWYRVKG